MRLATFKGPDVMHLEFVTTLLRMRMRMRMRGFGLGVIPT
jgi:hypothetical protein